MEERARDPSKRASSLPDDLAGRPVGLLLLLLGVGLLMFFTYVPIIQAQEQAPSVAFNLKWVFIQPLLFALGIPYTVFGGAASKVLGPTYKPSVWGVLLIISSLVAGFFYANHVQATLQALGYQV
jgi:hypothetical protein